MNFKFLSPASEELRLAAQFYEKGALGLGSQFLSEVKATILRIIKNPRAWSCLDENIRRC
jgi:hypothetical protein